LGRAPEGRLPLFVFNMIYRVNFMCAPCDNRSNGRRVASLPDLETFQSALAYGASMAHARQRIGQRYKPGETVLGPTRPARIAPPALDAAPALPRAYAQGAALPVRGAGGRPDHHRLLHGDADAAG